MELAECLSGFKKIYWHVSFCWSSRSWSPPPWLSLHSPSLFCQVRASPPTPLPLPSRKSWSQGGWNWAMAWVEGLGSCWDRPPCHHVGVRAAWGLEEGWGLFCHEGLAVDWGSVPVLSFLDEALHFWTFPSPHFHPPSYLHRLFPFLDLKVWKGLRELIQMGGSGQVRVYLSSTASWHLGL